MTYLTKNLFILLVTAVVVSGCLKKPQLPVNQNLGINQNIITSIDLSGNQSSVGENWSTYINDKYGYSLSYPNTWRINNETKDKSNVSFGKYDGDLEIAYFGIHLVEGSTSYTNIVEWYNNERKSWPKRSLLLMKLNTGELLSLEDNILNNDIIWISGIFFIHNNQIFEISYQIADGDNKSRSTEQRDFASREFRQIVQSINFK